jgi:hypothetical protein
MDNWRLLESESLFTYLPGENTGTHTGVQTCDIHLSADDLEYARQRFIARFGKDVCDEAMLITIAIDFASGMTEDEVFAWIDDFQGECEIDILATRWYEDADGDGWGNPDVFLEAETQPTGYVSDNTDCDDTNPLLSNGSFEDPVISSSIGYNVPVTCWTSPAGFEVHRNAWGLPAADGNQWIELDFYYNTSIYQDIPTVPDQDYIITFAFSDRPGGGASAMRLLWDGIQVARVTSGTTQWDFYSYTVTATNTTSRVEFAADGASDSVGDWLDAVSIEIVD